MAKIEGFRVKNFKSLKDVTLGKLSNLQQAEPLTPLTVVIGKNGAGKSTLFDIFGFLADCLKYGVEEACDKNGRGGFNRLCSQGTKGPIEFELYYKQDGNSRPITYELAISLDKNDRPYVSKERLKQRRKGQSKGWPFSFLYLIDGKGAVWKGESEGLKTDDKDLTLDNLMDVVKSSSSGESSETDYIELDNKRKLGIATLGSLKQHPRISKFRQFIEGWYLSYFTPDAARSLPMSGPQRHLNRHGDNLGNVVQFMEREHETRFKKILENIANKIPGINTISTDRTEDGRLLLKFNDRGFSDPFYSQQMSDGTLKVFAYLLLLEDPTPPPFLCIEEPENGLYHKLLETLTTEFREHATGRKGGSQVFITTHQPYLVDALEPKEVWLLTKGEDGFSTIQRVSDNPLVKDLAEQGLPLGSLWYSDYFETKL
jgi:predicted ATPase